MLANWLNNFFELHIPRVPQGAADDRVIALGNAAIIVYASPDDIEAAEKQLINSAVDAAKAGNCEKISTEFRSGDP